MLTLLIFEQDSKQTSISVTNRQTSALRTLSPKLVPADELAHIHRNCTDNTDKKKSTRQTDTNALEK